MHPVPSRFPTTNWMRIRRSLASREEFGDLLATYWSPVYAYLRRKGHDREEAQDLTQAFLADVLIGRDLLGRADESLGRFRSYLLTALNRFAIDKHRQEYGRPGDSRPAVVPSDPKIIESAEPCAADDPAAAFDRQWAATIVDLATRRVEADCRRRGLDAHWAIFEAREYRPACAGIPPVPVENLAREHGVATSQVYSMLNTVTRKLRTAFTSAILETIDDPDDLEGEMAEVRRVLALPWA